MPGLATDHTVTITPMTAGDLAEVLPLWHATEGLTLRDADRPEALERFLEANPGLSFVARAGAELVGAVICGTDGRRAYLHHLAVVPERRRSGLGRALVERCMGAAAEAGLTKCHLFVRVENEAARRFWTRMGWEPREDIVTLSRVLRGGANA